MTVDGAEVGEIDGFDVVGDGVDKPVGFAVFGIFVGFAVGVTVVGSEVGDIDGFVDVGNGVGKPVGLAVVGDGVGV